MQLCQNLKVDYTSTGKQKKRRRPKDSDQDRFCYTRIPFDGIVMSLRLSPTDNKMPEKKTKPSKKAEKTLQLKCLAEMEIDVHQVCIMCARLQRDGEDSKKWDRSGDMITLLQGRQANKVGAKQHHAITSLNMSVCTDTPDNPSMEVLLRSLKLLTHLSVNDIDVFFHPDECFAILDFLRGDVLTEGVTTSMTETEIRAVGEVHRIIIHLPPSLKHLQPTEDNDMIKLVCDVFRFASFEKERLPSVLLESSLAPHLYNNTTIAPSAQRSFPSQSDDFFLDPSFFTTINSPLRLQISIDGLRPLLGRTQLLAPLRAFAQLSALYVYKCTDSRQCDADSYYGSTVVTSIMFDPVSSYMCIDILQRPQLRR